MNGRQIDAVHDAFAEKDAEISELTGSKAALQTEIERLRELCDNQQAEIERLARNQMSTGYVTLAQSAALQAQEADARGRYAKKLEQKCEQLTEALMKAMTLVDEMLRENGRLCAASGDPPNVRLFAAKASFDTAMHKLLGDEEPATTTADTTEVTTSLTTSTEGEAK
jgi:DNA repair exonuclease SbcCD ATPase subunit